MSDEYDVFLSYSRSDADAASRLKTYLKKADLSCFWDTDSIRASDAWLGKLQDALEGCHTFISLIGRDGLRPQRWMTAEAEVALTRHFGPQGERAPLPIYPLLLPGARVEDLPPLFRLFQAEVWDGEGPLPEGLLDTVRERLIRPNTDARFEGCPFVGLGAFRVDQAQLFFGREQETLDALACFDRRPGVPPVRWVEINGQSGSGKSSLMQAGLIPFIDQAWLWPRTGIQHWRRVGPMMPGSRPVEMLAEVLARTFETRMAPLVKTLTDDGPNALKYWLRERKAEDTAVLLAIDQFEELFTFADPQERVQFDALLAAALEDPACPLYVLSTVRSDFLDRFVTDLPRLVATRNTLARQWTLAPIREDALRQVIEGPARLAGIDVSEITEAMIIEARGEEGVLPLVENALTLLWEQRLDNRLSGQRFSELGGLAGMLSHAADQLLEELAADGLRDRALNVLLRLVRIDPQGVRHARRRLAFQDAVQAAGGGEEGRRLIDRLAGRRVEGVADPGPVRLVIISDGEQGRTVSLIHETLIRAREANGSGRPRPYWPTLWNHIERHREEAGWLERIAEATRDWLARDRDPAFQWSHERVREAAQVLTDPSRLSPDEQAFLGPVDPDTMLAKLEDKQTTHKQRLLIGERLAILGDPRPGIGVDADGTPQIAWHDVDGSEVTILITEDPTRIGSRVRDRRTRRVERFRVARYPVTLAQYQAFLEAEDGWRNEAWWGDDLLRDPEGLTYRFGRFANHPVLHVNWFDAMAFCRWLGTRTGLDVALPDEWQRQQAAGGGTDFPWGAAEWDARKEPWRANTFESRLGQATAVGMYPAGMAPCGALDMGGTVWEWCANKMDRPEETTSRPRDFDSRVLRGGSWFGNQDAVRAGLRVRGHPDNRDDGLGFRVVVSSPSPGR